MATDQEKRDELIGFLDREVFDPILQAPDSGRDKEKLEHVKRSTESEKRRFHEDYRTATDVRNNYFSDLSSGTGKRINKELEALELPSLPKVKREFAKLCERLGVSAH